MNAEVASNKDQSLDFTTSESCISLMKRMLATAISSSQESIRLGQGWHQPELMGSIALVEITIMAEPRTPSVFQVLHELNKQLAGTSIKESVKDGNLGMLKKSNPLQYSEGEWDNMINFLSENLEIDIVAKVKDKEKPSVDIF